jgi:hypothetical protein
MISWLFKAAKTGEVKTLAQAIRAFFQKNNRMPSTRERNEMGSILQDITKKSNVIEFPKDRITPFYKPRPGDVKKTDESPLSTLLGRQSKELEGIDTKQGMGFYREMGDMMKKHDLEELELKYDEMYNKILDKAKQIERDPLPLLEAELGKKLTGKETTTELLEIFKNRPKKASGGLARVGMFLGGGLKLKKFLLNKKTVRKAVDDIFPTGDYKYDAEMAAEALVENNPKFFKNKLLDDLSDADRSDIYGAVLSEVQNDLAKMLQMKRLSQPKKTLEGIKKEGTIDISNPEVADEFTKFMKESDPKGYKDLEQKIEIEGFDVTGRKKNASGGIAGQLHLNQGGRARFANGSPLVDARMQNTYAENIAANEAQKTENLKTRAISALGDATGYTQHNINNQLLRNALADKQINEAQYKRMGGYDVAQQMPDIFGVFGKPAGVAAASTGYNIIKSLAGLINPDDPNAQYGDIGRVASILENTRGSTGLSPENLALYNQIISGQTSGAGTQQSELDRFKTAWDMTHYGMPSEEVNWYGTGRPNYERSLKEYQTWNQGPWSSPETVAKMTSSFGQAPGYALAKGGLAKILGV